MCAVAAAFSPFVDVAAGQVLCCNGEPFVSNSTTVSGTVFVSETLALAPTLHFITVTNADVVGWEQLTLAEAQRAAGTQACTACGLVSRLVPILAADAIQVGVPVVLGSPQLARHVTWCQDWLPY
jgi:hypothetical protein